MTNRERFKQTMLFGNPAVDHAVPTDISLQNYLHFLERIRMHSS